jgi:hypothetical protein
MTTEQPPNPTPEEPATPPPPPPPAEAPAAPEPPRTFEQRMDDFGKRAGEAGEKLGKEAEAAAERWKKDPPIPGSADNAPPLTGLILLAHMKSLYSSITLGLDVPDVAWRDIWPLGLIVLGLAVLIRGMSSRRA